MSTATYPLTPKGSRRNKTLSIDAERQQLETSSLPQNPHVSDSAQRTTNSLAQPHSAYESQGPSDSSRTTAAEAGGPTTPTKGSNANRLRKASTAAVRSESVTKKSVKAQKTRVQGQRTSSSPLIRPETGNIRPDTGTTRPVSQASPLTSSQSTASPLRAAYAGPTFHASPAPSALPMPSFFSKSVPEVNNDRTMQALMGEDASNRSEESPQKENAQITGQRQVREESPLDIFFKADRDEKAERRKSSAASTPNGNTPFSPLQSSAVANSRSASVFEANGRHHSRHPTDGSISGMFALEMDGAASPGKSIGPAFATPYTQRMNAVRSNTAPSNILALAEHDEEQRKAKTKALKMLLLSPQPQRPASVSMPFSDIPPRSLSPSPSIRTGNSSCKASGSSSPVLVLDQPTNNTRTRHHASAPFLRQNTLLATTNGSPRPRPPSSNLRQEVTTTKSPDKAELPAFPDLSSPKRPDVSTDSRNSANASSNGNISSSFPDSKRTQSNNDIKSMEDDLRRILKLDILGHTGAKDIRNGVVGS